MFNAEFILLVDILKQRSTYDGSTASVFFKNAEKAAEMNV